MAFDPATLRFDDRGLLPVIAQEEGTGEVLMLAWMNANTNHTGSTEHWLF